MLRLHFIPGTSAMAPHAALAEAGATYTLVRVAADEYAPRPLEYVELNPWGQVPTLEDDDLVLTEASGIMLHIADRFPEATLAPPIGSRDRSDLYVWLAYLSTTVQQVFMRWFYPDRFTADVAAAPSVHALAESELRRHLAWIDSRLAERVWLVGDEHTGADMYLFMLTWWGRKLDPPARRAANLGTHFDRMRERPSVTTMLLEQGLIHPPDRA
ncbi:MAG TPA: glutathione binding-like protein [Gaiellales bacterium]|nr:glutathione binding-like protein [Gaiellales bacterium]